MTVAKTQPASPQQHFWLIAVSVAIVALAGVLADMAPEAAAQSHERRAKNVILLIADGAGFNCFLAAAMYQGQYDAATGQPQLIVNKPGWLQLAASTYPLSLSTKPQRTGKQDPEIVYDPKKAWDHKAGYAWLTKTATDSAGAGTAMATGRRTYNNAINWSDWDQPIEPTLMQIAKSLGKSTGVVTSVQWSHATPATLGGAKVPKRDDYVSIARQMLSDGVLDVIMGAGHPQYDNNGLLLPEEKWDYRYVGGREIWEALEQARLQPGGTYLGFRPVVTKEAFDALCSGPTPPKVVGTAMVGATLQASRTPRQSAEAGQKSQAGSAGGYSSQAGGATLSPSLGVALPEATAGADVQPFADPLNTNVPSLQTMVCGALNVLDDNPNGFVLMIEGGAIDWANHANRADRMIEEMIDFLRSIETVVQWVETHSSWEETLVIVTADHETGLIWGPQSDKIPFQPLEDRGPGNIPGLRYNSTQHSNSLVPLYARGPGAEAFRNHVEGNDPVYGPYVHLASIFHVIVQAMQGPPVDQKTPK